MADIYCRFGENQPKGVQAMTATTTVNMDRPCRRCKKMGATDGGYCLKCILKNLREGKYDHILKAKP